jgi:hypothetical protein
MNRMEAAKGISAISDRDVIWVMTRVKKAMK